MKYLIFALLVLLHLDINAQEKELDLQAYKKFDARGGAGPGGVIPTKSGNYLGKEFKPDYRENILFDEKVLRAKKLDKLAATETDRTKLEKARLRARLRRMPEASDSVKNAIRKIAKVTIYSAAGDRIVFDDKNGAFERFIKALPTDEVCELNDYVRKNNAKFITEGLRYGNATVTYKWEDAIPAVTKKRMMDVLDIDGGYELDNDGNLKVYYSKPIYLGYKSENISNKRKKMIKKYCEDVQLIYEDKDGDGFGNSLVVKEIAIGANIPKGYSVMPGDCCDDDARAFPGQKNFFENKNNCQSFDYNCDGDLETQADEY
ncbi:MAG: hypothetical protein WBA74_07185 [Cyclobacteriaceae bacterium]